MSKNTLNDGALSWIINKLKEIANALTSKVDKEKGKGLSTNDLTNDMSNSIVYVSPAGYLYTKNSINLYSTGFNPKIYDFDAYIETVDDHTDALTEQCIITNMYKNAKNLESFITSEVYYVNPYAFAYCTNLKEVTIGTNNTLLANTLYIRSKAFADCTALESISITGGKYYDGCLYIADDAFEGCTNLHTVSVNTLCTQFPIYNSIKNLPLNNLIITFARFYDYDTGKYEYPDAEWEVHNECAIFDIESVGVFDKITTLTLKTEKERYILNVDLSNYTFNENFALLGAEGYVDIDLTDNGDFPDNLANTTWGTSVSQSDNLTIRLTPFTGRPIITALYTLSLKFIGCTLKKYEFSKFDDYYLTEFFTGESSDSQISEVNTNGLYIPSNAKMLGSNFLKSMLISLEYTNGIYVYDTSNVVVVGCKAFYGLTNEIRFICGDGIRYIADNAFANSGLTRIHLPSTIEGISSSAFSGCTSLTTVTVGENFDVELNLTDAPLDLDVITNILRNLKDNSGGTSKTITLGSTNLSTLNGSPAGITYGQMAVSKNWKLK